MAADQEISDFMSDVQARLEAHPLAPWLTCYSIDRDYAVRPVEITIHLDIDMTLLAKALMESMLAPPDSISPETSVVLWEQYERVLWPGAQKEG